MKAKVKSHVIAFAVTLILAAVWFYFALPAISIHNSGLLIDIVMMCVVYTVVFSIIYRNNFTEGILKNNGKINLPEILKTVKITVAVAGLAVVVWAIGSLTSAVIFNAKRYQALLTVEGGDFLEDVNSISYSQIPTLDSDSAVKLGDRKMGELSDMVSQFSVVDSYYTQINYKGKPVRVTPLEYVDVFKWFNNVSKGIPGYIMIDMVTQEVDLVRLSELGCGNMKYSTAEHFNRNLYRHLRFKYPTYMFEEPVFEVDDNGIPYWVCAKKSFRIGLYGGQDIDGVVLVNAADGSCVYYDISEVPTWVDRVYNANLIITQFDYHGTLQHGFWNSIFSQRDCQETTDGYNYVALNDDVYMYTGVTSVAADQSNIGFILTNQRTKETKFYSISGAEEYSAMRSAEGQVQNLRYSSTFPLLLNIGNEPTYFVALKDDAGLVKMYAMVNVSQYQIVATGQSLKDCEANYVKLIKQAGISSGQTSDTLSVESSIIDIRSAVIDGNSHYFFKLAGIEKTFICSAADNNEIVTYNRGDMLKITYVDADSTLIRVQTIERTQNALIY